MWQLFDPMHGHSREVHMSRSNVLEKQCSYCACTNQMYSTGTVNVRLENYTPTFHILWSRNVCLLWKSCLQTAQ